MKFHAIIDVADGAPMSEIRAGVHDEVRGAWSLFAAGILREAYATEKPTRVVFILEAANDAEAAAHLLGLPLIAAGLFTWQLTEMRPFANWSQLFSK